MIKAGELDEMYIPTHFEQGDLAQVHQLIERHPLGILVNQDGGSIAANHLPFQFSADENQHGILRAHVAKANPVWQALTRSSEVLVIFQGPEAYISPSWYPSKQNNPKVVPTWNYTAVHIQATATIKQDPESLRSHLEHLVQQHEAPLPQPWAIADAPEDFISNLLNHIVGIKLVVTNIEAKWKASQNQPEINVKGVVDGLASIVTGREMAQVVEQTCKKSR
jgi:transcriptional regulator